VAHHSLLRDTKVHPVGVSLLRHYQLLFVVAFSFGYTGRQNLPRTSPDRLIRNEFLTTFWSILYNNSCGRVSISQYQATMSSICCCFRKPGKKDHNSNGSEVNETAAYGPAIEKYFNQDKKKEKNSDDEASISSSVSSVDTIDPNALFVPLIWSEIMKGLTFFNYHQICPPLRGFVWHACCKEDSDNSTT